MKDLEAAAQQLKERTAQAMEGGLKRLGALGLKVFGGLFVLPGVIAMGVGFAQLIEHQQDFEPLTVGVALVVSGALLWKGAQRLDASAQVLRLRRAQNQVLQLAQRRGGRLMVTETAAEARLTVEEAENILKDLADRGYVELEVTDSGMMVYRFPEMLYAHEKPWSRSIDRA